MVTIESKEHKSERTLTFSPEYKHPEATVDWIHPSVCELKGAYQNLISSGILGPFIPLDDQRLPPATQFSRGMRLKLPHTKDVIVVSGIGLVRSDEKDNKYNVHPPTEDLLNTKSGGIFFSTTIIDPETGKVITIEERSPFGGYWTKEMKDKVGNTQEAHKKLNSPQVIIPTVLAYGQISPKLGWLSYQFPEDTLPLKLLSSSDRFERELGPVPILEQFGKAIAKVNKAGLVHVQLHLGNWGYKIDRDHDDAISIVLRDWSLMQRRVNYGKREDWHLACKEGVLLAIERAREGINPSYLSGTEITAKRKFLAVQAIITGYYLELGLNRDLFEKIFKEGIHNLDIDALVATCVKTLS